MTGRWPGPVERGHVLRQRDRDTAKCLHGVTDAAVGFEHVADHENDREAGVLNAAAAEGHAGDQSFLIHPVDAASPGAPRLRDHP